MTEKATHSRGLVHVYTGDGKGKTTAALGLAIRALGHDKKVLFIQFMKSMPYGEHNFAKRTGAFPIVQLSKSDCFTTPKEIMIPEAQATLEYSRKEISSFNYDMVILDEILVALKLGLLETSQVVGLIEAKPANLELVLTGRGAPPEIVKIADYVTEMLAIKHPYDDGVMGRAGIEF